MAGELEGAPAGAAVVKAWTCRVVHTHPVVQVKDRAKWDVWNGVKGMSKEEAMQVRLLDDANDLKLFRCRIPHSWSPPPPPAGYHHSPAPTNASCPLPHTHPHMHTPQRYIDLVAEGNPGWESHEALKDYREDSEP